MDRHTRRKTPTNKQINRHAYHNTPWVNYIYLLTLQVSSNDAADSSKTLTSATPSGAEATSAGAGAGAARPARRRCIVSPDGRFVSCWNLLTYRLASSLFR